MLLPISHGDTCLPHARRTHQRHETGAVSELSMQLRELWFAPHESIQLGRQTVTGRRRRYLERYGGHPSS